MLNTGLRHASFSALPQKYFAENLRQFRKKEKILLEHWEFFPAVVIQVDLVVFLPVHEHQCLWLLALTMDHTDLDLTSVDLHFFFHNAIKVQAPLILATVSSSLLEHNSMLQNLNHCARNHFCCLLHWCIRLSSYCKPWCSTLIYCSNLIFCLAVCIIF